MVLTKEELLSGLRGELRLLLHLMSKVEPAMLDYRPSPKQRSLLELLQYLTLVGPIHMKGVLASSWSMAEWGKTWNAGEAVAKTLGLAEARASIESQAALFEELLAACTGEDLRAKIEMFGQKSTRGPMLVSLVLCHLSAYRMQLFLYLKGAGRDELNTMNLWAGIDGKM